jgi:hypothetical protein
MGAGELIGMRWILWEGAADIPEEIYEALMDVVQGALAPIDPPTKGLRDDA